MSNPIKSILIFIFIVGVVACSSSRNDISEDVEGHNQSRPILKKSLAPETAQVKAVLVDYKDNETYYSCLIKLEKILGYGPATPPLAEGTELQVEIVKNLIKTNFETTITSDRLFTMTLRKNRVGIGIEAGKQKSWSVIKIE